MIRLLLSHVGKYKKDAVMTPVCAALEVLMETLIPFITASLIDQGIEKGDMGAVFKYGGLMVLVALLSLAFAIGAGRYSAKASTGFAANLRSAVYKKIQSFSFANIDKFSTSGLITRMTTDITSIQNAFAMSIRMAVRAPLTLIMSLILSMTINARISLIFLVAMVFLILMIVLIIPRVSKIFTQVFKRYDALNESVQENVSAIRVVKAYTREEYEKKKFSGAAGLLYKFSVRAESMMALTSPVMMTIVNASIIAVSWVGAKMVVGGDLTTGELTSLFSYCVNILMSLMMLSFVFVMITMSIAAMKRTTEVLNEVPAIENGSDPKMQVPDGSIRFDHVSFAYKAESSEYVLSDLDFSIRSGETIGILGATGSGKSSLVSLISRLYDVSEGSVSVGGVDVRSYDLDTLRNAVAVVLQKNVLFSGTILENLRWGKPDATLEECKAACRMACADEFIESFPDGYETKIEQGGTNVSGGQRQRLCIARALLKDPRVLILDDSTSAVDTATDARIKKALRDAAPDVTKLIIAQRVSSVQDADRIMVLEDGKINGFDTPEKMKETNEIYRYLVQMQTGEGSDFDEELRADHLTDYNMEDGDNE